MSSSAKYWYTKAVKDLFSKGWNGEIDGHVFTNAEDATVFLLSPPKGWAHFGSHAGDELMPDNLEFSGEGEDGLPEYERCGDPRCKYLKGMKHS